MMNDRLEAKEDNYFLHISGQCGKYDCQYCEEEYLDQEYLDEMKGFDEGHIN